MKKLVVLLIAISGLASACIVVDPLDGGRGGRDGRHEERDRDRRDGPRRGHDADGDGVPDRQDKRPVDPRRY